MIIEVEPKKVFGPDRFYPVSDEAKALCRLLKKPTLTLEHLQICEETGWKVEIVTPKFTLQDFVEKEKKKSEMQSEKVG